MVTEDGDMVQRAEKETLRRKLTGPPRLLLLGKTRTRRDRDKEGSPARSCRGRCGAAADRKSGSRRWWRRFSPAAVCNTKQKKKNAEERLEEQKHDGSDPPEGAQQEALNTTEEENAGGAKGRRRFNMTVTFRRFLSSTDARQKKRDEEPARSLRKTMTQIFSRRRKRSRKSSGVRLEDEAASSPATRVDEAAELRETEDTTEVQLCETLGETPTGQLVCDIIVTVNTPEPIRELDEDTTSPAEEDLQLQEKTTSRSARPTTNGPSIRIQLVPPDDEEEEEEEDDDCWDSSENHQHLLLLGLQPSERQLLQAARSLVRAAMTAAVDQLTRERQSEAGGIHREPPGCRDHA